MCRKFCYAFRLRRGRGWGHRLTARYLAPVTAPPIANRKKFWPQAFFQNLMVLELVAAGRNSL
jgi:hypothetical protein